MNRRFQMHNIVFTLGKTQPPHAGHYIMLADALCTANNGHPGKLIHFVGSTNVPSSLPASILTFEERERMLTRGLETELRNRFAKDPKSVPEKFRARIEQGVPLLTTDDFSCIALPDFSHPQKQFTNSYNEKGTIACPDIATFDQAIMAVDKLGTLEQDTKKVKLCAEFESNLNSIVRQHRQVTANPNWGSSSSHTVYGQPYVGWAINLKTQLDNTVTNYAQLNRIPVDTDLNVTYEVCGKDAGTQQYIDLTAGVIRSFNSTYSFNVKLTQVKKMSNTQEAEAVSATFIREAIIAILNVDKPADFILSGDAEKDFPILAYVSKEDKIEIFTAAKKLKDSQTWQEVVNTLFNPKKVSICGALLKKEDPKQFINFAKAAAEYPLLKYISQPNEWEILFSKALTAENSATTAPTANSNNNASTANIISIPQASKDTHASLVFANNK
jgi:hypothetical protein